MHIRAALAVPLLLFAYSPALVSQDLGLRRTQYAVVAGNVVPGLSDGAPQEESNLEPAVIEARERWRVITLDSVEAQDRRIRAVAKEAAEAHRQILDLAEADGDGAGILVDLAVALAISNPLPLARSVGREVSKGAQHASRYDAAVQRRRAATFLLPELARELAGDARKESSLELDFDENWFGEGLPDRVNLTNTSGSNLTNCTVQIDIRGRAGKWVRNVHFVPSWISGKKIWADYISNDPGQLAAISGTTATEVQDLRVSLWCDELRAEGVELHYPGKARDDDRAAQLEKLMDAKIDYVESPLFEDGPCIGVTLTGVARLPACKVEVLCHGGNKIDQILEKALRGWQGGERVSLQSRGALNRCPDSVDVSVRLDGSDRVCKKSFRVSATR